MPSTVELIGLVIIVLWPLGFVLFFRSRVKAYLIHSYAAIVASFIVSFSFAFFYYRSFIECKTGSILAECSFFPEQLVAWYGEWSLVFNICVSSVFVLALNLIQLSKRANEI